MAGGSSTLAGHVLCIFLGEKGPQGRRAVYWNLSSRGRVEEGFGGGLSWFASMAHGPRQSLLMLCGTADLAPDSHLRIPPPPPSQGGRKQAAIEHLLCAFTRPHALNINPFGPLISFMRLAHSCWPVLGHREPAH